jgi:ribosomal protein L31
MGSEKAKESEKFIEKFMKKYNESDKEFNTIED